MKTDKKKEDRLVFCVGVGAACVAFIVCALFVWLCGVEWSRNIWFALCVAATVMLTFLAFIAGLGIGVKVIEDIKKERTRHDAERRPSSATGPHETHDCNKCRAAESANADISGEKPRQKP